MLTSSGQYENSKCMVLYNLLFYFPVWKDNTASNVLQVSG